MSEIIDNIRSPSAEDKIKSILVKHGAFNESLLSELSSITELYELSEVSSKWCKDGESVDQRLTRERADLGKTILALSREKKEKMRLQRSLDLLKRSIAEKGLE